MSCKAVFVYGTLQPGEVNAQYFDDFEGSWEKAHVLGHIENHGWGAERGFPGIRLHSKGTEVKGSLFVSEDLDEILALLDELEGADYWRVITQVCLADGAVVDAYIYELAIVLRKKALAIC